MKVADIDKLSQEEKVAKLAELKAEYAKLKVSHKVSPIENPIQLKTLRKTIARIATLVNA